MIYVERCLTILALKHQHAKAEFSVCAECAVIILDSISSTALAYTEQLLAAYNYA